MADASTYPKRPKYFATKFCRLVVKACVANELGPEAAMLLTAIVSTEDARGYRGPVNFWNAQMLPLIGCRSESAFKRIRAKCEAAGWLVHQPGTKWTPPLYHVAIPSRFDGWDDAASDEGDGDYDAATADGERRAGGERAANDLRANSERAASELRAGGERPDSFPVPEPIPVPSVPSERPVGDPQPSEQPAKKPRKQPTGLHPEAIQAFETAWQVRYGTGYIFGGGRDAKAVKAMLSHCGGDLAKFAAAVARYLAADDAFLVENRHPLWGLASSPVRWLVDAAPPRAAPKPMSDFDRAKLRMQQQQHTAGASHGFR